MNLLNLFYKKCETEAAYGKRSSRLLPRKFFTLIERRKAERAFCQKAIAPYKCYIEFMLLYYGIRINVPLQEE